jgi:hypothetical protein
MDAAILRMDVEPRADAELLFCCPSCGGPGLRRVVGELLTLLLLVGVEPLRLSEPTLPEDDRAPALAPLTWDDLLTSQPSDSSPPGSDDAGRAVTPTVAIRSFPATTYAVPHGLVAHRTTSREQDRSP